jgi:hypothetical protein
MRTALAGSFQGRGRAKGLSTVNRDTSAAVVQAGGLKEVFGGFRVAIEVGKIAVGQPPHPGFGIPGL